MGKRVVCLAPTHAGARLLPDGDTVHHFVGEFAMTGSFKGYILLDEVSMCCLPLIAALDQLRLLDTKIITFGDFDQLPPHPESNSWRGEPVQAAAFKKSRLYKHWSDCTCFQLTRCRRSDKAHFDFYTTLPDDLRKAISKTKKRFLEPDREVDLHVCLSHYKRRKIGLSKQQEAAKDKACIEVPSWDDPAYPLFEGTKLVGNCTNGKFTNGARYLVKKIGPIVLEDIEKQLEFETSLENIAKNCILAWALTYPKL